MLSAGIVVRRPSQRLRSVTGALAATCRGAVARAT
jgi:hypothetical protein